jgi:hypothetical protein
VDDHQVVVGGPERPVVRGAEGEVVQGQVGLRFSPGSLDSIDFAKVDGNLNYGPATAITDDGALGDHGMQVNNSLKTGLP